MPTEQAECWKKLSAVAKRKCLDEKKLINN